MTSVEPKVRGRVPDSSYDGGHGVMRVLGIPAVDRTIAIVASLPFVYALYLKLAAGTLNVPRASVAFSLLVVIITMVLRRAPERVTPNPLWWLLAFAATYGPLAWSAFTPAGRPIVPIGVTSVLAVVSVAIVLYARMSLGRNICFVPAQRRIVTSDAYRYVRHPIYSGLFLAWGTLVLRLYSPANLAILFTAYTLIVIKCLVEEGFLRHDQEYEQYMRKVRYRFIPGVV